MRLACFTSFQVASWYVLFLTCCIGCGALWVCALAPSFLLHSYHRYLSFLVICDPFPFDSSLLLYSNMKLLLGTSSSPLHQSMIFVSTSYWRDSQTSTHCSFSHAASILGWSSSWRSAELLHCSPSCPSFKLPFIMWPMENRFCRWLSGWPALLPLFVSLDFHLSKSISSPSLWIVFYWKEGLSFCSSFCFLQQWDLDPWLRQTVSHLTHIC